jgi:hypothetical protein
VASLAGGLDGLCVVDLVVLEPRNAAADQFFANW